MDATPIWLQLIFIENFPTTTTASNNHKSFKQSQHLEGPSPDGYDPTSQEARDQDAECGACRESAGHAAPDAGAGSGDAPAHKHDATRAGSKCARLRRTLTKLATKAGFRTANTLCTAIILCIMLFGFLVLAKELGWHVLHPSNSFKDLQ